MPLSVPAQLGVAMPIVLLWQLAYLSLFAASFGAMLAVVTLWSSVGYRVIVGLGAVGVPILFKAWPLASELNPVNTLLFYHALANGLSSWLTPLVMLFIIAGLGVLPLLVRHRSWSALRNPWTVYGIAVVAGAMTIGGAVAPDESSLLHLLYGADPEGMSFVIWTYAVIVWLGMAMVLLVGWSDLLSDRLPMLLLRSGSSHGFLWRELLRNARTVGLASVGVLLAIGGSGLIRGHLPRWTAPELVHHLVVGPGVALTIVVGALIPAWITGRTNALLAVVGLAVVGFLPITPVFWPRPLTTAFQAIRLETTGIDWGSIASTIAILTTLITVLLLLASRRPIDIH